MKFIVIFQFCCLIQVQAVSSLSVPVARTSLYRLFNWVRPQQSFSFDDTGIWWGNDVNFSTCGRCGDAPENTHDFVINEGIINATYNAGQVIDVIVQIHANGRGHFFFELCPQATETDDCQSLNIVGVHWAIYGPMNVRVELPANVTCTHCVLRWTCRTSCPPDSDECSQPNPTQTFRNRVDIRIN